MLRITDERKGGKDALARARAEQQIEQMLYGLLPALMRGSEAIFIEPEYDEQDRTTTFYVRLSHRAALGELIGKQGKTAQALRTLIDVCGRKYGQQFRLEIDTDSYE